MAAANAATVASYSASASPGAGFDGNGNTVDVWTVTGFGGSGRSYSNDFDGNTGTWAIWDRNAGVDGGFSETQATHVFAGGPLLIGQTVTLDYTHYNNVDSGERTGIRFLDGNNTEIEYGFLGGSGFYSQYDTVTGVFSTTTKQYDNNDFYQIGLTLTGANSYTMTVTQGSEGDGFKGGPDNNSSVGSVIATWSGTFTGSSITAIQVFTAGGDGSDQLFDNLVISPVPEPTTAAFALLGAFGLLSSRRRRS